MVNKSPQIYTTDNNGREVLIGLTFEETVELAILDAVPPQEGSIPWEAETSSFPESETRWLELFEKHLAALAAQSEADE